MADEINKPNTHFGSLESRIFEATTAPTEPEEGQMYYDTTNNKLCIYAGNSWKCKNFTTTTSTSTSTTTTSTSSSTSTTTTSTSTTSTSSSSSSSTSTSTSSSTSTTTTL